MDKGFAVSSAGQSPAGARNQERTKTRPTLETLESRIVPASFTPSSVALPLNATSLVIQGSGFDPNPAMDVVDSETTGITTGNVLAASPTSLTVAFHISPSVTAGTTLEVYGYVRRFTNFLFATNVASHHRPWPVDHAEHRPHRLTLRRA